MSKTQTLKEKAIHGMVWNSVGSLVFQLLRILTQIILARLLFPEAFGLLAIVFSFFSIAQYLIENGMTLYLIRVPSLSSIVIATVHYSNLIFSIIIALLYVLASPFVASSFGNEDLAWMLQVLSITLIFVALANIHKAMLTRDIQFKGQVLINLISATVSGVIAITLAMTNFGLLSLVLYHFLFYVLQWIFLSRLKKVKYSFSFDLSIFRESIGYSWKLMLSGLIHTAYENVLNVLLGGVYSVSILGSYSNALKIRDGAAQTLTDSVQRVSFPVLSNFQDNLVQFKASVRVILKLSVFVIFPILFGLAALSEGITQIMFGDLWLGMIPLLRILAISGIFIPLHKVNLNILSVLGRTDLYLKLEVYKKIFAFITLSLGFLFKLNIEFILWILLINALFGWVVNVVINMPIINYTFLEQMQDLWVILVGSSSMAILVWVTSQLLNTQSLKSLIISILVGALYYIGYAWLFLREAFNLVLDNIFIRVYKRLRGER